MDLEYNQIEDDCEEFDNEMSFQLKDGTYLCYEQECWALGVIKKTGIYENMWD